MWIYSDWNYDSSNCLSLELTTMSWYGKSFVLNPLKLCLEVSQKKILNCLGPQHHCYGYYSFIASLYEIDILYTKDEPFSIRTQVIDPQPILYPDVMGRFGL